jgi:hypothetical protein
MPRARATPAFHPSFIAVPITAKIFGPGLAMPTRNTEYAIRMLGRYSEIESMMLAHINKCS